MSWKANAFDLARGREARPHARLLPIRVRGGATDCLKFVALTQQPLVSFLARMLASCTPFFMLCETAMPDATASIMHCSSIIKRRNCMQCCGAMPTSHHAQNLVRCCCCCCCCVFIKQQELHALLLRTHQAAELLLSTHQSSKNARFAAVQ